MKKTTKTINFGGKQLSLTFGEVAQQATSSCLAQYGETVVLATVVAGPLDNDPGYFPLTVEYQERLYAGGRIKGSRWVKREGRPSDDEILIGRLIDRSVRPLFPKDYKKNVQITVTVLSVDFENSPDVVAGMAVSAILAASSIPWNGPVVPMRVGRVDKKFVLNPVEAEKEKSDLDLVVSVTEKSVIMIEAGAREVTEDDVISAIEYGQKEAKPFFKLIKEITDMVGEKKDGVEKNSLSATTQKRVRELVDKKLGQYMTDLSVKKIGHAEYNEFYESVVDQFEDEQKGVLRAYLDELASEEFRQKVLAGKRLDGRKSDEIRKLSARVEVLPRTHGSAIFERGETQVMSVVTLAPPSLEQTIESAEGEETKRYMHHYSMPPYSVGEVGRVGFPSRREIGHGALAERALLPVLPENGQFPYAIRVVSEVLSSNGSTSMASTCGSTLALMDAGVPISAPVVGIAMGLVVESEKKFVVLTDITGLEDGNGDMDFKVAGTGKGITALQLDVKTLNLTPSILKTALTQAKSARDAISRVMLKEIAKPREKVSSYAPKIKMIKINPEKIGEVIGPGGRMIKAIIAESGAQVDVEDDGTINISGMTDEEVDKAVNKIELLTKEINAGEIYDGEVKRIEPFGAFVEIVPGREGLVHVSDMSQDFVKNARDVVSLGQQVKVRVKEIDNLGRVNLSMLLEGDREKPDRGRSGESDRYRGRSGRDDRFRSRHSDRSGRGFQNRTFHRNQRDRQSSGPHFPTSRYLDEKKKY